jgi:hypothetical protein
LNEHETCPERLWSGNTFVDFEQSLATAVKKLRRAGTGVISETWALQAAGIPVPPWREESTRQTFGNALSKEWIPALR